MRLSINCFSFKSKYNPIAKWAFYLHFSVVQKKFAIRENGLKNSSSTLDCLKIEIYR